MATCALSCCSTADVSPLWLEERNIRCVYFNFELGGESYKDDFGRSVSPHDLYLRMLGGESAKTSQVSPGDYLNHFRSILEEGNDLVHVTLSSGISKTCEAARLAAQQLQSEFPGRTIRIVDSLCASAGYGLLMERLAKLRDTGMDANELADWAEKHRLEVNHLFFSSDLTFFIRGGRISKAAGLMGGMLHICPLMHVAQDGSLQVKEKIRSKARAESRMVKRMLELADKGEGYDGPVFISQSECEGDALEVAQAVRVACPSIDGDVRVFPIGATIGCHTGPGTVALFFWGSADRW